jgi:hypothetical protein
MFYQLLILRFTFQQKTGMASSLWNESFDVNRRAVLDLHETGSTMVKL